MTMVNFNLDLAKHDNFAKAFTARQGDAGEQFQVTLFDNQVPYVTSSGDVVSLRVVTPTGKFASVAGTIVGNKVTFTLTGQITSEAGYYKRAYVAVSNGSTLRTTQDLIFFSLGNSDINQGQADYYVAELDKLLQQLNEEFDEWLQDREQDYSDLLARIVALTNRVTNLETKLDDIIAQLQKNQFNTRNVFDPSRLSKPETPARRRMPNNAIDINGWGLGLVDNANTLQMLEPNKTYHTHYIAELLSLNGGELYPVAANAGLALYSGVDNTKYPTVWIAEGVQNDFKDIEVGGKIERSTTFTTPATLRDSAANYRILAYSRRDNNGVTDTVRYHDLIIQEGSMYTGFQPSADDTITKYDETRYIKSVLPDFEQTGGLAPITTEKDSTGVETIQATYTGGGVLLLKNMIAGRARAYWTASQLGLSVDEMKQPFNIRFKMRHTGAAGTTQTIEIGYSGQSTNATFNVGSVNDTYVATIQSIANTAVCIYLPTGVSIEISQAGIYPANTDITSNRIETIENRVSIVERSTVGNPEILSNANLNTVTRAGNYVVYQPTNSPVSISGIYGYLQVYGFDNNNRNYLQVLTMRGDKNRRYFRQQVNGNWQEWRWFPDIFSDGRVDTYTVDFDTLKETGVFVNTSTTNSPDGATSTSWYTEVIRYGSSGNYVYQRATKISNVYQETYERQLFNGAWSAWRRISAPYIDQLLGTASDANKITTTQNIQLEATATANLPTSGTGVYYYLETIARADNYVLQRATLRGATFKVYVRQSHNGTWSAWREMAFV